jgi:AcrR family transcriptional regulator
VAIEQFGRHGFDTDVPANAEAARVNPEPVTRHFGSREEPRKSAHGRLACGSTDRRFGGRGSVDTQDDGGFRS